MKFSFYITYRTILSWCTCFFGNSGGDGEIGKALGGVWALSELGFQIYVLVQLTGILGNYI
jgi:hypothetical protein